MKNKIYPLLEEYNSSCPGFANVSDFVPQAEQTVLVHNSTLLVLKKVAKIAQS
jgi:hypothetical protein